MMYGSLEARLAICHPMLVRLSSLMWCLDPVSMLLRSGGEVKWSFPFTILHPRSYVCIISLKDGRPRGMSGM